MSKMMDLVKMRDFLPTWGDGEHTYWIFYSLSPGDEIHKGPMFEHDLTAYGVAEWLVNTGLVHCAWIVADVTGKITKRG